MGRRLLLTLGLCGCTATATGPKDTDAADTDAPPPDTDVTGLDTSASSISIVILEEPMEILEDHAPNALIAGTVTDTAYPSDQLTASWSSSIDGDLGPLTLGTDGSFSWPVPDLSPGIHQLTLTATAPDADTAALTVRLVVCAWPEAETFASNVLGNGWAKFGDAVWDPGGWLEVTTNNQSMAGSIYKIDRKVNPGDFILEFRIATGGGINSGADGYAVNLVNVDDVDALTAYVNSAANGGCLGYGISPGCVGSAQVTPVDALHVEFDTWYNGEFGDPTSSNHIELTFDGNPEVHPLWSTFVLEDLQWRTVLVQARGTRLRVQVDGQVIIDRVVPDFQSEGGYIGVSGSTGWASNYHRFDDLRIVDRCEVPEEE